MNTLLFAIVVLCLSVAVTTPAQATSIRINQATIQNGYVTITGGNAPRLSPIRWEGELVGKKSTANGNFALNTPDLPRDCVGRLRIGSAQRDVVINDCTPAAVFKSGVQRTGQTTSYASGDDGDLERGIVSPDPRFTDNSDGTITDNLTGLVWLKHFFCPGTFRNWETALADVAELNTLGSMNGNSCGDTSNGGSFQTDWRLPNRNELLSLLDLEEVNPPLPVGHPFTDVLITFFWSSTTYADFPASAWSVDFSPGDSYIAVGSKSNEFLVTAVRAGN